MKRDGRLPESELDIMLAVWEAGEKGATAPGILEGLARPLTASALHSYLKRRGQGLSDLPEGGADQPLLPADLPGGL